MMPMKKYRSAIIGCGNIASLFDKNPKEVLAYSHAGAYSLCPKTELIAACDVDPNHLRDFAARWKVKRTYIDYKEMFKYEDIDILSVCTPPKTHCAIVKDAAKTRIKAIYCEKPIASSVVEAKAMIKSCRDKKVLLMVNHQRRFSPFWREIKIKIDKGFLGGIQQVNCYYTRGIYNTGVHILDLFVFLFGRPVWTMASMSTNKSPVLYDPNIEGMIRFSNGLAVSMKPCDDAHYLILEIDILGSKGRLRIGRQVEYLQAAPSQNLLGKNELTSPKEISLKSKYGPIPLTYGLEHIIRCLQGREKPLSSGEQALISLEIIEAMMSSAKKKKIIYIGKKQ